MYYCAMKHRQVRRGGCRAGRGRGSLPAGCRCSLVELAGLRRPSRTLFHANCRTNCRATALLSHELRAPDGSLGSPKGPPGSGKPPVHHAGGLRCGSCRHWRGSPQQLRASFGYTVFESPAVAPALSYAVTIDTSMEELTTK